MKVRLTWFFAAIVALVFIILYIVRWSMTMTAPLSIEYEGPCLWATIQLAHGSSIYDPSTLFKAPWEVVIYPPVFFLICVPFQVFAGTSYWGLRLVSILAFIVSCYSSYRIFFKTTNLHLVSSVALISYISFLPICSWSSKGRVDMLSMALSIVAIDLFLVAFEKRKKEVSDDEKFFKKFFKLTGIYCLFIICCVLAIYTKQPAVLVPITVAIYLLTKKYFFDYLIVAFGSGIISIATLWSIDQWTGGGFMQHMRFLSKMPFSWNDLNLHLAWMGSDWAKLLLLPICMYFLSKRKPGTLDTTLPVTLILLSGILTFYSLGTMYANVNHAMHFYWATAWLMAICLAAAPVQLYSIVLFSTLLSAYALNSTLYNLGRVVTKMPESIEILKEENLMGTTMFVEDPALALEVGATPLFVDVATFKQVWDREERPLDDIREAIENTKYSAIVINRHDSQYEKPPYFWSAKLVETIRKHYKYQGTVIGNGELQDIFIPQKVADTRETPIDKSNL